MRAIFRQRGLRLIFIANLISMLGSGMNTAAVVWYILQVTHSEMALGTVVILQTLPALLMLPFSGVIIDREDRRLPRRVGLLHALGVPHHVVARVRARPFGHDPPAPLLTPASLAVVVGLAQTYAVRRCTFDKA